MAKYNWETRFKITVNGQAVAPVFNVTTDWSLPAEVLDDISQGNVGYNKQYPRYSFSFSIPPVDETILKVEELALKRTVFDIVLSPKQGEDWVHESVLLKDCIITGGGWGGFDNNRRLPVITFPGKCLAVQADGGEIFGDH